MTDSQSLAERGLARGRWQHSLADGRVQCDLCPRYCRLHDGQRAFCFVRQRIGTEIFLTSYGLATGFCIDPIEKKPLNHFHPGSSILSFGTAGCNLGCKFCQNWDISKARQVERLSDAATPERIARTARESGCRSVAFTYNDPVIFAEYAIDTARECRAAGVATVAVTAGYVAPQARRDLFSVIDAANVDLKAFTEGFYRKLCFAALGPVLDTLVYLKHETDVWFEVTTLLIEGHNDSEAEIDRLVDWMLEHLGPDVPLHFTAFHPDYRMRDVPPTSAETCRRARARALELGVHHVYSGNVHDRAGQSTYCAACGALLIERDWYELGRTALTDGRCGECGAALAGRFEARVPEERWGRRRLRVHMR